MEFTNVKQMEAELKKVTSLDELKEDITFTTQGEIITVKFMGDGSSSVSKEVFYMAEDDVDTVRVEFSGDGNNITVTNVKATIH